MNIVYVDSLANKQYAYYSDLHKALSVLENVVFINCKKFSLEFLNNLNIDKIDAIIFGTGWMSQNDPNIYVKIKGLQKLNVPTVCLLHKPQSLLDNKLSFCKVNNIDLLVYSQIEHIEYGKLAGCKSMRLWMAGDPDVYRERTVDKIYDFGFSGALHGGDKIKGPTNNLRNRVHNLLKNRKDIRLFWNGSDSIAPRIRSIEEYATTINQSKIWLTTTGPLEDISPRYFEIGLSKTLIFCNKMPKAYENVFKDGVNCVMFENDLSDFDEKLTYCLRNEIYSEKIIENAYKEFLLFHTWNHRAKELVEAINDIKEI